MRHGLISATILAALSLVNALASKDRIIIAEVKQAGERTTNLIQQDLLKHLVELSESIVNARVADPVVIHRLQILKHRAEAKLERLNVHESDLYHFQSRFAIILDMTELDENAVKARLRLYTNDAVDDLFEKNYQRMTRQIQVFIYTANPKIRELSEAAQESEKKLITAFNDLAFSGLSRLEDLFGDFMDIIETY